MTDSKKQTSAFDAFVGEKVKIRRMLVGMSQERLGELLGLTFQQIQKYEKGVNRISAGRLFEVSVYLNSPITYFYEGLSLSGGEAQGFAETEQDAVVAKFLSNSEGLQLAHAYMSIDDPKTRKSLLELAKSLSGKNRQA